MTRSLDRTWAIALCLSLLFHGGAMILLVHGYIVEMLAVLPQPPLVRAAGDVEDLIYIDASKDHRRMVLGDSTGAGYAVNASPGEDSMLAREGSEDQAWLSRDPVGLGGDSTRLSAPRPQIGAPPPPPEFTTEINHPFGLASTTSNSDIPHRKVPLPSSAIAMGEQADPEDPVQTNSKPQTQDPNAASGGAIRAGDPAPMSDSDSDPFARIGSAEFRPGKVDVKLGRKHRLTRPRLLLAGREALLALRFPSLVLKISIDSSGNVSAVDVLRSSGSNEIDQPCQLAAYDWWFEPSRDVEGNAIPDVILFTIQWR